MMNIYLKSLPVVIVLLTAMTNLYAQTPKFLEQKSQYLELCNTLDRPNVDCQCVANSHATYAHLSPNARYSEYLIESYKEKLGLPNNQIKAFERYLDGRPIEQAQMEMYNAFNEFESADPFINEVDGCVIDNAPRVSLAALPSAPIFKEVYEYRVSSTGYKRVEQCQLVETQKALSADELAALHYVIYRGVNESVITANLKIDEETARARATAASKKLDEYQQTTRNIGNYCASLLAAEEGSSGSIIKRFVRTKEQREGAPLGLGKIDITQPRGAVVNHFGNEVDLIQQDIAKIKKDQQTKPTKAKIFDDIKQSDRFKEVEDIKNTPAKSMTASLLDKACAGAGQSGNFCECFVDSFMNEIGEGGGAAAIPVVKDGLSNTEMMALMQTIDQGRYMQDMTKAMNINTRCENAE